MFRKILASVLCLMLALAMPLSSLAATDVTLKIIPGADLAAMDENVSSIFNNLFLRVVSDDNGAMLALESNSGEIVSGAFTGDENGFYVASPLLGDRTLYFTMEDLSAFMVQMMKDSGMSDAELAEFEAAMSQMTTGGMNGGMNMAALYSDDDMDLTSFNDPASVNYEEIFADDPAMLQYIESMLAKMVVTEGDFTDAAHNPATTKTEMTMTSEDMALIFDSKMVKDMYGTMAQSAGMDADEFIATMKDVYSQLNPVINMTYLSNGDELCAMEMDMVMKGDVTVELPGENGQTTTETEHIDMTMDMTANVLTQGETDVMDMVMNMTAGDGDKPETLVFTMQVAENDEADSFAFVGNMKLEEENIMDLQGVFTEGEDDAIKGWFAILFEGQQVTVTVEGKETNDVYDMVLGIGVRENAAAIVEPTWSDDAMISFAVQVKEVETPDMLKKLAAATPETSVQLLQMTEQELQNEISAISGDAMGALFTGLGNLPPELLSLLMTME
ncbi:MAG: hypothetical protein IJ041_09460 [Clostridia bacterium]|nr:hypothetical protein [Clostridia bacterium]